jgi:hypothetical protein
MVGALRRRAAVDRFSADAARSKLEALQRTHDLAAKQLVAAASRIETLSMLLQQERVAAKALLLHVAATGSCLDLSLVEKGSGGDPFDIDDGESIGLDSPPPPPTAPQLTEGLLPKMSPVAPAEVDSGIKCGCAVLRNMRPHAIANDMLVSRRRLAQYVALVAANPAALAGHHDMLASKALERINEISAAAAHVCASKEVMLQVSTIK